MTDERASTSDAPTGFDEPVSWNLMSLPDGRTLEWTSVGPADGVPLLFHHGTPSGATPVRAWASAAAARGLRLVCAARPGYGRSDRLQGRTVADVAADSRALLNALEAPYAYVAGTSGGGPHALACGALLPERVLAVTVVAGVGAFGVPDLDFLAGMGQDNLEEFEAALSGESVLRAYLDGIRPDLLRGDTEGLLAGLGALLPPVDLACLDGPLAEDMAAGMANALAPGVDGWLDDDLEFTRPWGFDLDGLAAVPVSIWQGSEDLMVPFAHGEWLVERMPWVSAHLLHGEGHLSIGIGSVDAILDELTGGARAA